MRMCKQRWTNNYFRIFDGPLTWTQMQHAGNEVHEAAADDDARALHQNDCNQRSQILFIMESNST